MNIYDLQYLTNPCFAQKIQERTTSLLVREADVRFYRKRIFQLTKEYLQGKKQDNQLDNVFERYAAACIDYFKFVDKSEIIQEDYKKYSKVKKSKAVPKSYNVKDTNQIIMKKNQERIPKITDSINIKTTRNLRKMIIPQQRNINLRESRFKYKK